MHRKEASYLRWLTHEAGHAVAAQAVGYVIHGVRVTLAGSEVKYFCLSPGSEEEAQRAAIVAWAGQLSETLILPASTLAESDDRDRNHEGSDEGELIGLAARWAPDPVQWTMRAKKRSLALLSANVGAIRAVMREVMLGRLVCAGRPCLSAVVPLSQIEKPAPRRPMVTRQPRLAALGVA